MRYSNECCDTRIPGAVFFFIGFYLFSPYLLPSVAVMPDKGYVSSRCRWRDGQPPRTLQRVTASHYRLSMWLNRRASVGPSAEYFYRSVTRLQAVACT